MLAPLVTAATSSRPGRSARLRRPAKPAPLRLYAGLSPALEGTEPGSRLRIFHDGPCPRFETPTPPLLAFPGFQPSALVRRNWSLATPDGAGHDFLTLHVWSPADWQAMTPAIRPTDVHQLPDGSRVALRIA